MRLFKNIYRTIRIITGLVLYEKFPPRNIREEDGAYPGLNGEDVPMKIFHPPKPARFTLVLYPGASPHAEKHPGMILLGMVLASAGYQVFLPRMPLLKDLIIKPKNVEWFVHFYTFLLDDRKLDNNQISLIGTSFGGGVLLKASLSPKMQERLPRSFMTYGTYFDIHTALRFLLTGKINVGGETFHIQPNQWGLVVLFFNYLDQTDTGYETRGLKRALYLRINDRFDELEDVREKLTQKERELLNNILDFNPTPEIKRVVDLFFEVGGEELASLSPRYWAEKVSVKTFVIHGANDSMVPYTESIELENALPDSHLLISYLYEHREMSNNRGILFQLKELSRMGIFFYKYISYNDN